MLAIVLAGVDRALKDLLHQEIESPVSYTEYHDGMNSPSFRVRQRPLVSITNLYEDSDGAYGLGVNAFPASTLLTSGTDYTFRPDQPDGSSKTGLVYRVNGFWAGAVSYGAGGVWWGSGPSTGLLSAGLQPALGTIKITYVGGYSTIPPDLILTEILVVSKIRQMKTYGAAIQSEGYEGYNYSLRPFLPGLFDEVADLWKRYRALE